MISQKRVIAWIPARGGSKGIKNKNIKLLNNKPLIAYTIEAAAASKYIDRIMVSTDNENIANIAKDYGAWVPGLRPAYLADDMARTIDAVVYSIQMLHNKREDFQIFCLLQPTSPLRDSHDIDAAIERYIACGMQGVVSVSPTKVHPRLMRSIDENGNMQTLLSVSSTCRRQDMEQYFLVNGCIYINDIDQITQETSFNDNPIPFFMDESHSVDIDDMTDWAMAEYWLEQSKR